MANRDQVVNLSISADTCLVLISALQKTPDYVPVDGNWENEFVLYLEQAYRFQATTMAESGG